MKIIKILLFPFAILYGIGVFLRNKLYEIGVFRSNDFAVPTISVGNLSTGGTGKSPHIEYLIKLLRDRYQIAVLSRGYGRSGSGYKLAGFNSTAREIGDEPMQFHKKFPEVSIAVGENRSKAIRKLLVDEPDTQAILLDDAFQHRAVNPGVSILLTKYDDLFMDDFILPSGNLREWAFGYKRADIIVVTKCPSDLQSYERRAIRDRIHPLPYQQVFFSGLEYDQPYDFFNPDHKKYLNEEDQVILLCGIANIDHIKSYVTDRVAKVEMMRFKDHYYYRDSDLHYLRSRFEHMESDRAYVLTTEKDAMRLALKRELVEGLGIPFYVLPVEVGMSEADQQSFHEKIFYYLKSKI
jgi:tetraacyldisaccharide 4'-kinase